MGNASEEVKAKARFVTASNEEDGFARAVKRYLLSRDPENEAAAGYRLSDRSRFGEGYGALVLETRG